MIKAFQFDYKCCILLKEGLSEAFQILTVVKQGDVLSLILFLLINGYGLRKVERDGFGINFSREELFELDFADNVALTAGNKRELQWCTKNLIEFMGKTGLCLKVGEFLCFFQSFEGLEMQEPKHQDHASSGYMKQQSYMFCYMEMKHAK